MGNPTGSIDLLLLVRLILLSYKPCVHSGLSLVKVRKECLDVKIVLGS